MNTQIRVSRIYGLYGAAVLAELCVIKHNYTKSEGIVEV
jgi:hypothetical protein